MLRALGLSWDHTNGRRLIALLVVLLLAFSIVGILTTQAPGDVGAAPDSAEIVDGEALLAGGSWSFVTRYNPKGGFDFDGMSARGASWS